MTYPLGCGPECPCQHRRRYAGTWTVFSTGVRYRLDRTRRRGRVQWFRWVAS